MLLPWTGLSVAVEFVAAGDDCEFPADEFELDEDVDSGDEVELDAASDDAFVDPGSEGLAEATHGIAASPAPMPRATANAPIRPIYVTCPMVIPSPSPGRLLARIERNCCPHPGERVK
jgi:hypothetical protein